MPTYHEAFWVLMGTIAPIIALANVVTFSQATDAVIYLRKKDRQQKQSSGNNSQQSSGNNSLIDRSFSLLRHGHIYFVGLCFALSLVLILLAALSLWQREDAIAGSWVIALLLVTFLLLFVLGACSASFNRKLAAEKAAEAAQKD